jgi:hypothetical protein
MDYENPQTISTVGGAQIFPTGMLNVDMHPKIFKSYPSIMPILAITTKMSMNPAHNYRVDATEEHRIPTRFVVGTSCAAGATTLVVVANGTSMITGTVLWNPDTDDYATVDSKPTSNSITITKSAVDSTGQVWASGTVLWALLPRLAENLDERYEPVSADKTNVFNYIQLIRMQCGINRVANDLPSKFGPAGAERVSRQRQKLYHAKETLELNYIGGARSSSGTAPASYRTFGGWNYFLRSGTLFENFNGVFTQTGLNNMMLKYQEENPDTTNVWMFTSPNVINLINDFGEEKLRINAPASNEYKMDIWRYSRGGLTANLVPMPLLTDPTTRGWGFVMDMDRVLGKMLNPLTLILDAKGVGNSEIIYDLYRGVYSMLLGNENRHLMFIGALN